MGTQPRLMTKNVKAKMARVEREESPIQQSSQNWSQEKLPMKTVSIIIKEPALCYCKYNQNQMQYSSTFKRRKKKERNGNGEVQLDTGQDVLQT